MDPNTGTFLSVDPVIPSVSDPQSLNAYAYARNNPVNLADPNGMCVTIFTCGWDLEMHSGTSTTYTTTYSYNTPDGSRVGDTTNATFVDGYLFHGSAFQSTATTLADGSINVSVKGAPGLGTEPMTTIGSATVVIDSATLPGELGNRVKNALAVVGSEFGKFFVGESFNLTFRLNDALIEQWAREQRFDPRDVYAATRPETKGYSTTFHTRAFKEPQGTFRSIVGHELVHVKAFIAGDINGHLQALNWELNNAALTGAAPGYLEAVRQHRDNILLRRDF